MNESKKHLRAGKRLKRPAKHRKEQSKAFARELKKSIGRKHCRIDKEIRFCLPEHKETETPTL